MSELTGETSLTGERARVATSLRGDGREDWVEWEWEWEAEGEEREGAAGPSGEEGRALGGAAKEGEGARGA